MPLNRNSQLIRQWRILRNLMGPPGWTINALAEDLGVSNRTIRRDLEALQFAGFPLIEEVDRPRPMARNAGA